jgi:MFS transporter, FLVCR family, feline leukemia virus subgroup C receptor-related protein
MGVFGNQMGTAIGFLIPPIIVPKSESIEFMQTRLYYLLIPVATLCTTVFIISLFGKI